MCTGFYDLYRGERGPKTTCLQEIDMTEDSNLTPIGRECNTCTPSHILTSYLSLLNRCNGLRLKNLTSSETYCSMFLEPTARIEPAFPEYHTGVLKPFELCRLIKVEPPRRIELRFSGYKADVLPFNYGGI